MDAILHALNTWHQSNNFAVLRPWLQLAAMALVGLAYAAGVALVSRDALLADLRRALLDAGVTDKQLAGDLQVCQSVVSLKLSGQRPLTFDTLAKFPGEALQWFVVRLAERIGVPSTVTAGARLARRQARMSIGHAHARKAGVA